MVWMLGLAALLAACDQGIKAQIRRLPVLASALRLDGILEITHVNNTGAAFSLLSGQTGLLAALSIALLVGILWYVQRQIKPTRAARFAVAMLLGGAVGNLIDRVRLGAVTDYIRVLFIDFPVFNFADILITVSIGALMLLTLTGRLEEKGSTNRENGGRQDG